MTLSIIWLTGRMEEEEEEEEGGISGSEDEEQEEAHLGLAWL